MTSADNRFLYPVITCKFTFYNCYKMQTSKNTVAKTDFPNEFCTVGSVCTHYSLFLNEPMLILLLTQAKAQVLPVVISLSRSVD